MTDKLTIEFPSQGWRQFLTSRKEMLDAFDNAREKARAHEVEVHHGRVAEAEFRKWLSGFLPKRYGVTAGYIVSPGFKGTQKAPHFDVIIYEQLESPILWIEDSPDTSLSGRSLAIPVEHVRCVLEVKATLSSSTSREAIEHLADLAPLMKGLDDPSERYKLHLSPGFRCGLVFFDLRQENMHSEAALSNLMAGTQLRGFFGGVVLRSEGQSGASTGRLSLYSSETPIAGTVRLGEQSLLGLAMTESVALSDAVNVGVMISWAEMNFSQFGFDLLAMMQGTYEIGRLSSFHAIGATGI